MATSKITVEFPDLEIGLIVTVKNDVGKYYILTDYDIEPTDNAKLISAVLIHNEDTILNEAKIGTPVMLHKDNIIICPKRFSITLIQE